MWPRSYTRLGVDCAARLSIRADAPQRDMGDAELPPGQQAPALPRPPGRGRLQCQCAPRPRKLSADRGYELPHFFPTARPLVVVFLLLHTTSTRRARATAHVVPSLLPATAAGARFGDDDLWSSEVLEVPLEVAVTWATPCRATAKRTYVCKLAVPVGTPPESIREAMV